MPRLAMCIPAYNAAWCLPRLLKSAAEQSWPFDEILVYDDCSTDGTAEIAARLGATVVRGDTNRGPSVGKTRLAAATDADWIHFHDADDDLKPGFVEAAREWMPQDVDVVVFGCEERWEEGGGLISMNVPDDAELVADTVGYSIHSKINAISGLYRRQAFLDAGGFDLDPDVLYNEDQALHCKLALAGLRFRGDPRVLVVNYRQEQSFWTSDKSRPVRAHYHLMRKMADRVTSHAHRRYVAERLWLVAGGSAAQLDWATADEASRLALRLAGAAPVQGGALFGAVARISPALALRLREYAVRALKPRFRDGYPGWRSPVNIL